MMTVAPRPDLTCWPMGTTAMARRMRDHDWAATPLGPPETWPESLRILTEVMLAAAQPMFVAWGPDRITLYNDAYAEILADKHPMLGQPLEHIWPEIWEPDLRQIVARAYAGDALHMSDITFRMFRNGRFQEAHFSFSYTPVRDASGRVQGFFCPCLEITEAILEERRVRFRETLTEHLRRATDPDMIAYEAASLLAQHLGADQAAYAEIDTAGEYAIIRRDWNKGTMQSNAGTHRLQDFGAAFIADLMAGQSVVIGDVTLDRRTATPTALKTFAERGIAAFVNVPHVHGRLTGVLALHSSAPRDWHPADVALAFEVAERINRAMERARAEDALVQSEARFRALVHSTSDIAFRVSADWAELEHVDALGQPLHNAGSAWIDLYVVPEDQPRVRAALAQAIAAKAPVDVEHRWQKPDDTIAWIRMRAVPLCDASGTIYEWFGASTDITQSKRLAHSQRVLLSELDHRVKNILAVVQSIAHQTFRSGNDPLPDDARRLLGRISALAESHRLLARSSWQGASFHELIDGAVAPHRFESADRITVDGPDLQINPRAAQTLVLALHELVTNAAKYGALSQPQGTLSLSWTLNGPDDARCLTLLWHERHGPKIDRIPDRRGFGSLLIEHTLAFELEGSATLDFAPDGLRVVVEIPVRNLVTQDAQRLSHRPQSVPPSSTGSDLGILRGKNILVVEDEHLVAQETVAALTKAGCTVIGPIPNVNTALVSAAVSRPDAAILDINLGNDFVWPVALLLHSKRIPFVFVTGYAAPVDVPEPLQNAMRLEKPLRPDCIVQRLADELAAAPKPALRRD